MVDADSVNSMDSMYRVGCLEVAPGVQVRILPLPQICYRLKGEEI